MYRMWRIHLKNVFMQASSPQDTRSIQFPLRPPSLHPSHRSSKPHGPHPWSCICAWQSFVKKEGAVGSQGFVLGRWVVLRGAEGTDGRCLALRGVKGHWGAPRGAEGRWGVFGSDERGCYRAGRISICSRWKNELLVLKILNVKFEMIYVNCSFATERSNFRKNAKSH